MARDHARIRTQLWRNEDFTALSADAQWVFMMVLSQPDLNLCGVVAYRPRYWAGLATGLSVARVRKAAAALERTHFVVIDADTDELWVTSFLRYDGVLKSPNTARGMARHYGTIHSERIRRRLRDSLPPRLQPHFPDDFFALGAKELGQLIRARSGDPASEAPSEAAAPAPSPTAHPLGPEPVEHGDEDPVVRDALGELARRDVERATADAAAGKGPQVRSSSGLRNYRLRERRLAHLEEARRLVETYDDWVATELADVLDGQRERLRHKRRRAG